MSIAIMVDKSSHVDPARKSRAMTWASIVLGSIVVGWLIAQKFIEAGAHAVDHHEPHLPHYWGLGITPFVLILAAIAFLPLISRTQHWWENNQNRLAVSMVCAALTLIYVAVFEGVGQVETVLDHAIIAEYIPFIVLLFALYVISGGIRLTGDLLAKPGTNTAFLATGALLASFIGTTGASMLLIRPVLETNRERRYVLHTVIFFIFLVSNIGGSLLPIGDPPLFLGYLKGVEFFWTLGLTPEWAVTTAVLLIVYYVWDRRQYGREDVHSLQQDRSQRKPLRVSGLVNIIWLLGVVLAVAFVNHERPLPGTSWVPFMFMRELLMLLFVGLSIVTTPRGLREANRFDYHAILEVAALFIGIFIAMQIPVQVLEVKGASLGLTEPWQFFWATGSLSSFLDNAPTYVVFFETARAMPSEGGEEMVALLGSGAIREDLLIGISLGAVFMGAMTYIGNGPNFMVKSIAEQAGVRMPSFFGYMFRYSIPILVPLFVVVTLIFLL